MVALPLVLNSRTLSVTGTLLLGLIFGHGTCAAQTEQVKPLRSLSDPLTEQEQVTPVDTYVSPDEIVRGAFEAPPGAKVLSKRNVWIDRDKQRVYADGYVAMKEGPLEMFACPMGTKEHESIIGSLAHASELHAALLAIGARPGTPVQYLPKFVPATGQRIRVWVCYRGSDGMFHAVDARRWVRKAGTDEQMDTDWVFAGSGFWKDPQDGREFYQADSGDMICVSNFSTAMLDVPIDSSAAADDLQFTPFTERIPDRGTPVRLVLVPIPIPSDTPKEPVVPDDPKLEEPKKIDPDAAPTVEILPMKPKKESDDQGK